MEGAVNLHIGNKSHDTQVLPSHDAKRENVQESFPFSSLYQGPFVGPNPRMALETRLATISLQAYWLTAFGAGGADVNSGILVIVVTKIDGSMLNWPICSKFAQCCCKFLNRFQKLATRCSTANIAKNRPQRGVTLERYSAQYRIIANRRCKSTSVTPP